MTHLTAEKAKEVARASSEVYPEGYYVVLCAHGNIDHGQDPRKPICKSMIMPVDTLLEAAEECRRFIDKNNLGSGNWVGGQIYHNGEQTAEVSYNGHVWDVRKPGHAEQEQADALGFSSVGQMREHQKFLEAQANHRETVRRLVKDSEGKALINIRGLESEPDSDDGLSPR